MSEEIKVIYVDKETHKRVKSKAVNEDLSMGELIKAMVDYLELHGVSFHD